MSPQEAETAKAGLDGKKALGRKLIVDWAKVDQGPSKKNVSELGGRFCSKCEELLFLSVQASTVSETWDANAVSKTLDGRAR